MKTRRRTRRNAAPARGTAALALAALALLPAAAGAQVVEYYHLDALGNVRAISNQAGQIVRYHDYLPFGEEWNAQPDPQPRRFTGKERDTETGLDYFGARYHGSKIGRFTTTDPVYTWRDNLVDPQRWNRYAYGRNNPLRYVDPDGRIERTPVDARLIAEQRAKSGYVEQGDAWSAGLVGIGLVVTVAPVALLAVQFAPAALVETQIAGGACLASAGCQNGVRGLAEGASGAPPGTFGTVPGAFLPDEYYAAKLEGKAPGQAAPFGRYERFDSSGNLRQVTTYDEFGDRIRQYDIGPGARHGEGAHRFDYDSAHPRQAPGGGTRSGHTPFDE